MSGFRPGWKRADAAHAGVAVGFPKYHRDSPLVDVLGRRLVPVARRYQALETHSQFGVKLAHAFVSVGVGDNPAAPDHQFHRIARIDPRDPLAGRRFSQDTDACLVAVLDESLAGNRGPPFRHRSGAGLFELVPGFFLAIFLWGAS
jgi:hypothetical protein